MDNIHYYHNKLIDKSIRVAYTNVIQKVKRHRTEDKNKNSIYSNTYLCSIKILVHCILEKKYVKL